MLKALKRVLHAAFAPPMDAKCENFELECDAEAIRHRQSTPELIGIISKASSRNGDMLLDFMEQYQLEALKDATAGQLLEYIANKGLNFKEEEHAEHYTTNQ